MATKTLAKLVNRRNASLPIRGKDLRTIRDKPFLQAILFPSPHGRKKTGPFRQKNQAFLS
jgi:hypothetical protein